MRIPEAYLSILGISTKLGDGGARCLDEAYSRADFLKKIQTSSLRIRQQMPLSYRQLYEALIFSGELFLSDHAPFLVKARRFQVHVEVSTRSSVLSYSRQ